VKSWQKPLLHGLDEQTELRISQRVPEKPDAQEHAKNGRVEAERHVPPL
jgi:hypothetical protein